MTSTSIFENPMPRRPETAPASDSLPKGAVRGLGLIVGFIAALLFVALVVLDGWAMSTLWRWFVADTFGITEIGIAQAIGLGAFVSLITAPKIFDADDDFKLVRAMILTPPFLTFFGWVTLQFV